MTAPLAFVCRCGHRFTTGDWVGWPTRTGWVCDADCPACGREVHVED